jgi:hypothetical protein
VGAEVRVDRTVRLTRAVGLALAALLVVVLPGCASPEYRYVGSDNRDLVLRLPRSWSALDTDAALKATGVDPATRSGWTVFYDADAKPTVAHLKAASTAAPFLYAYTIPITAEQRSLITDDALREQMLPSTPEAREAATKTKAFAMLDDEKVTKPKQHGAKVRYSYTVGSSTEFYEGIALTDTKLTRVHIVMVHCTRQCFRAHPEIDDVVSSLTLKFR